MNPFFTGYNSAPYQFPPFYNSYVPAAWPQPQYQWSAPSPVYQASPVAAPPLSEAPSEPLSDQPRKIFRIVITGGPCGGKSTSLPLIADAIRAHGYHVYSLPETATLMIGGGCQYPGDAGPTENLITFQRALLDVQLQIEASMLAVAHSADHPAVLLLDRSAVDMSAYLPRKLWLRILRRLCLTEKDIHTRYDAAIHLRTAAHLPEGTYTTANNVARSEGSEEAKALDKKVWDAWAADALDAARERHPSPSPDGDSSLGVIDAVPCSGGTDGSVSSPIVATGGVGGLDSAVQRSGAPYWPPPGTAGAPRVHNSRRRSLASSAVRRSSLAMLSSPSARRMSMTGEGTPTSASVAGSVSPSLRRGSDAVSPCGARRLPDSVLAEARGVGWQDYGRGGAMHVLVEADEDVNGKLDAVQEAVGYVLHKLKRLPATPDPVARDLERSKAMERLVRREFGDGVDSDSGDGPTPKVTSAASSPAARRHTARQAELLHKVGVGASGMRPLPPAMLTSYGDGDVWRQPGHVWGEWAHPSMQWRS